MKSVWQAIVCLLFVSITIIETAAEEEAEVLKATKAFSTLSTTLTQVPLSSISSKVSKDMLSSRQREGILKPFLMTEKEQQKGISSIPTEIDPPYPLYPAYPNGYNASSDLLLSTYSFAPSYCSLLSLPDNLLELILEIATTKPASLKRVCKKFNDFIYSPEFASKCVAGVIFENYGNKKMWHDGDSAIVISKTLEVKTIKYFFINFIRFERSLTRSEWELTIKAFEKCPDSHPDDDGTIISSPCYPAKIMFCNDGHKVTLKEDLHQAVPKIFSKYSGFKRKLKY